MSRGRRHDFIAIHVQDERERVLPNVGIITLEDAETGEQIEINTRRPRRRAHAFQRNWPKPQRAELKRTLRRNNIDTISLRTGRRLSARPALVLQTTRAPPGCSMNISALCRCFSPRNFTTSRHRLIIRSSRRGSFSRVASWRSRSSASLVGGYPANGARPKPEQSPRERALELLATDARVEIDTLIALSIQHPRLRHSAALRRPSNINCR